MTDDAVAEAFAQLIRRGDDVRDPVAWVWRSAFRIAAGELKRRGRSTEFGAQHSVVAPTGVEALPLVDLQRALAQLSPMQRHAVVLHDYAGFPSRQAAGIMGSTEAATRVHLMRGRRRLRALLGE